MHRVDVIKIDVEGAEMLVLRVRAFFAAHGYAPRPQIDNNVVFAWAGGGAL